MASVTGGPGVQSSGMLPSSLTPNIEYVNLLKGLCMPRVTTTTTMTVRLSGTLSDFVAANVGEHGAYENISEYLRDLIRRDMLRSEQAAFERLKAELTHAFSAPESSYKPLTAADVIARNKKS